MIPPPVSDAETQEHDNGNLASEEMRELIVQKDDSMYESIKTAFIVATDEILQLCVSKLFVVGAQTVVASLFVFSIIENGVTRWSYDARMFGETICRDVRTTVSTEIYCPLASRVRRTVGSLDGIVWSAGG